MEEVVVVAACCIALDTEVVGTDIVLVVVGVVGIPTRPQGCMAVM